MHLQAFLEDDSIIIMLLFASFFTPDLIDEFSLKSEWLQVSFDV